MTHKVLISGDSALLSQGFCDAFLACGWRVESRIDAAFMHDEDLPYSGNNCALIVLDDLRHVHDMRKLANRICLLSLGVPVFVAALEKFDSGGVSWVRHVRKLYLPIKSMDDISNATRAMIESATAMPSFNGYISPMDSA